MSLYVFWINLAVNLQQFYRCMDDNWNNQRILIKRQKLTIRNQKNTEQFWEKVRNAKYMKTPEVEKEEQ